jgi:hypothetical protein
MHAVISTGKRLFGRPRPRWEDNISMNLKEVGWEGVNWMHLSQDENQWRAIMNIVMKFWVS